jgi:hypothetical protein
MVLHLPHAEGGFGVTFNDITKDTAFHTTTSRFVVWLGVFTRPLVYTHELVGSDQTSSQR